MKALSIFKIIVGLAGLAVAPLASWRAPLYVLAGIVFVIRGISELRLAAQAEEVVTERDSEIARLRSGLRACYRAAFGDGDTKEATAFFTEHPELEPKESR